MTCAACSSRIQRRLEKLEAVADAQVNFANGRARINHDASLGIDSLAAEVESLGYVVIDDGSGDEAEFAPKPTSDVGWSWRRSLPSRPS